MQVMLHLNLPSVISSQKLSHSEQLVINLLINLMLYDYLFAQVIAQLDQPK